MFAVCVFIALSAVVIRPPSAFKLVAWLPTIASVLVSELASALPLWRALIRAVLVVTRLDVEVRSAALAHNPTAVLVAFKAVWSAFACTVDVKAGMSLLLLAMSPAPVLLWFVSGEIIYSSSDSPLHVTLYAQNVSKRYH